MIKKKLKKKIKFKLNINKANKEHNPKNLKISNHSTKISLNWFPKFEMKKIIDNLIKKNET